MFNQFLNKISFFAKFNVKVLLITIAIESINELVNRTKMKFDNSPQDNPEELGDGGTLSITNTEIEN